MNVIGWVFFAVMLSLFVGSLPGKYLAGCFGEPLERNRESNAPADKVYPRWYE